MAHFYHCQCGANEVVVSSLAEEVCYSCESCGNSIFINGYNASRSDFYIAGQEIDPYYECLKTDDGFKSIAYIDVPIATDFMKKKIVFEKSQVAYCTLGLDGKIEKSTIYINHAEIEKTLLRQLKNYIIESCKDPRISELKYKCFDREEKIETILFFLSHPNLKSFEFLFWEIDHSLRRLHNAQVPTTIEDALLYLLNGRNEKSVRRALFQQYHTIYKETGTFERLFSKKLTKQNIFDPRTIFVICRCFDDPNILTRLIEANPRIFETQYEYSHDSNFRMDGRLNFSNLIWFIIFLKRHYSEKEIAKLFVSVKYWINSWQDMLALVSHYKRTIKKEFRRVRLSVLDLHEEILRCSETSVSQSIKHMKFTYSNMYKNAAVTMNDLTFALPYTGSVLSKWAYELHNCMEGYATTIESRQTVIYGVFREKELVCAVEIFNNEIRQCSGKYNAIVDDEVMANVKCWYQVFFQRNIVDI